MMLSKFLFYINTITFDYYYSDHHPRTQLVISSCIKFIYKMDEQNILYFYISLVYTHAIYLRLYYILLLLSLQLSILTFRTILLFHWDNPSYSSYLAFFCRCHCLCSSAANNALVLYLFFIHVVLPLPSSFLQLIQPVLCLILSIPLLSLSLFIFISANCSLQPIIYLQEQAFH